MAVVWLKQAVEEDLFLEKKPNHQKMDQKKFIELEQREAKHFSINSRDLKNNTADLKKKVDELESKTFDYFNRLEVRMEEYMKEQINKSILGYDKKVADDLSMVKHYLKEYAGSGDKEMEKSITEKLSRDIMNMDKKLMKMFNVEGIVDNQRWDNDA